MTGPMRVPPLLTKLNTAYWTAGAVGELRIQRCRACGLWQDPPTPVCRSCYSAQVIDELASGKATVATFTINHQQWSPTATPDPYVIAIVELREQEGLRLLTNIVNCRVDEVRIGMPVRAVFEPFEDVWLPLFEPDRP